MATAPAANRPPGGARPTTRRALAATGALAALLLLVALSLVVGSRTLPVDVVVHALTSPAGSETDLIVSQVRVPRTLVGVAVGVALAVAGVLVQAVTRNPLAEPGLLGINAGGAFAVVLGYVLLGATSYAATAWLALAGVAVTAGVVVAVAASGTAAEQPARLPLAGVAVGAVLAGATSALAMTSPRSNAMLTTWAAGSLVGRDGTTALVTATVVLVVALGVLALGPSLDVLALGEDRARSLGSRTTVVRGLAVLGVVLLCGVATAAAGPVAFVGLMVPHALRSVVGPHQVRLLAWSLVAGPALVLGADLLGRVVARPHELPVGVVTAFLGAPVLIALVLRRGGAPR